MWEPSRPHRADREPACDPPHPESSRSTRGGARGPTGAVAAPADRAIRSEVRRRGCRALSARTCTRRLERLGRRLRSSDEERCASRTIDFTRAFVGHNDRRCASGNPRVQQGRSALCRWGREAKSYNGSSVNGANRSYRPLEPFEWSKSFQKSTNPLQRLWSILQAGWRSQFFKNNCTSKTGLLENLGDACSSLLDQAEE